MTFPAFVVLLVVALGLQGSVQASDLQCPSIANYLVQMPADATVADELDPAIAQGCRAVVRVDRSVVSVGIESAVGIGPTYFLAPSLSMALQSPFADKLVIIRPDFVTARSDVDANLPVGTQARSQLQRCLQTRQFLQSLGLPAPACTLGED